jgi:hypothetical protein
MALSASSFETAESSSDRGMLLEPASGMLRLADPAIRKRQPLFSKIEKMRSLCRVGNVPCQFQRLRGVI